MIITMPADFVTLLTIGVTAFLALAGLLWRHITTCNTLRIKMYQDIDKATHVAGSETERMRSDILKAMSSAALDAARLRTELEAYKALAKDQFASSNQVHEVESRLTNHLDSLERKFDEILRRWFPTPS